MNGERQQVLIVSDNCDIRNTFELHLSCENCNIRLASTYQEALNMLEELDPQVKCINIIDFFLDHGHNGVQLAIELVLNNKPHINILATDSYEPHVMKYINKFEEQIKSGYQCCLFTSVLRKPITGNRLREAVGDCMTLIRN